ncbi:hypothetical protein [Alkalihalobacillus sp. AL-G]|uniref:hypothetical protein n=1 Tax=Alkalihalobacillus sp. AL-G TaxID=2926399 RepID=UPI00272A3C4A|nr:hypothetical protein [Alkalihalobacillus sp. AL-G]WLD93869.1 hypothetical protein MOJ78_02835 [Alkalihalobacillus sp. AL-G]
MESREWKWGLVILGIVLIGYILPYTLLTNIAAWYGSLLLWSLLAIMIIIVNYFLTKDWGE